jgi:predicted N-acetyltransferase YhbS
MLAFYARNGFRQVGERRFQVGGNSYGDAILALDLHE